jgi:regulator of replication initiation timing
MLYWEGNWATMALVAVIVSGVAVVLVKLFFVILNENQRLTAENTALKKQLTETGEKSGGG